MLKRLNPVRTVAPAASLLALADAKAHLRVDDSAEDDLITALIGAAEAMLDGYSGILGRALITQTWREDLSHFDHRMPLRLRQVQSVVSVTYYDNDEVSRTLDSGVYRLHEDAAGAYLVQRDGQSWPSTFTRDDAVSITYTCGYGDAATDVPAPIRHAVKMLVAHWFENREAAAEKAFTDLPIGVDWMLAPHRAVRAFYA